MAHGQPQERVPVPDAIEKKMKLWRADLIGLPKEYVEWQRQRAQEAKALLTGYRVVMEQMIDDGWIDSMKFLALTILNKRTHQLSVIKWSDSQLWYEMSLTCGGWGLFRPEPLEEAKVVGQSLLTGESVTFTFDRQNQQVAAALGQ